MNRLIIALTATLLVAACAAEGTSKGPESGGTGMSSTPGRPTSAPSVSASPTHTGQMTIEQAGDYYLDWICWSNKAQAWVSRAAKNKTASQLLNASFQSKARRAAKIQRDTSLALDTPPQPWPEEVSEPVTGVVDDLLTIVSGLNALADAKSTSDVNAGWAVIAGSSNVTAQKVRLRLGLPSADSKDDGCEGRGDDPRAATPSPNATASATTSG